MVDKVVVTLGKALRTKYAARVRLIEEGVCALRDADRTRGLVMRYVRLDQARDMRRFGRPVADPTDPAAVQRALRAVLRVLDPAYVLLLGAPDVLPHHELANPLGPDDPDRRVPSDLPYACDRPPGGAIADYLGPTRVVGRLPGVTGGRDPRYLRALLRRAAGWRARAGPLYAVPHAVSAEVWRGSTALSLRRTFGSERGLATSPPRGPAWPRTAWARRVHLFNCHGDTVDPAFYGEDADTQQPPAHEAWRVRGRLRIGTIGAAECCYGAELYDARRAGIHRPMANEYLASKAYGWLGSTTIAYGPPDANDYADLLVQDFLRRVLGGASLGRALLEARQAFVLDAGVLDPVHLKTLAQFTLLGDPSIHPVRGPGPAEGRGGGGAAARAVPHVHGLPPGRRTRRRRMLADGVRLLETVACALGVRRPASLTAVRRALGAVLVEMGIDPAAIVTFGVAVPPRAGRRFVRVPRRGEAFHVAARRRAPTPRGTARLAMVVAHEVGGRLVRTRRIYSR